MIHFLQEDLQKKMPLWKLFFRMLPYIRRQAKAFIAVLLLILTTSVLSRVFPTLIGRVVDLGLGQKNIGFVYSMAVWYVSLQILYTILTFFQTYWFEKIGNRVLYNLREDLIFHVQKLPLQYFNKNPIGRIVTRVTNDVSALGEIFTDGVVAILIQLIRLATICGAMSLISLKLTLYTLMATPLFIYWALRISEKIQITLRESKKKLSVLNSFVAENLTGIKTVQIYNQVPATQDKFSVLAGDYRRLSLESIRNYAYMMPAMNLMSAVVLSSALYFGAQLGITEGLALGALVAFFFHAQDIIYPIREIIEKFQQFQNSLTSAERVFSLMDEPLEAGSQETLQPSRLNGIVEIRNLNFKYESTLPWVLKKIHLKTLPGEKVALVGRTGSGKTTLVHLLQNLYSPPQNSFFIDGVAIEKINRSSLRRRIGIVQQDNFIFKGTFLNNISLGDPSLQVEDVKRAIQLVGLEKILLRTHRTLESPIEERGSNLSMGERQLIAFARILAFKPDILILDEATSNIDSETEILIQKATDEITKGRTSFIIAHRLSTIENCDRILVMEQGEIKEEGTHEFLLSKGGMYADLLKKGKLNSTSVSGSEVGF